MMSSVITALICSSRMIAIVVKSVKEMSGLSRKRLRNSKAAWNGFMVSL